MGSVTFFETSCRSPESAYVTHIQLGMEETKLLQIFDTDALTQRGDMRSIREPVAACARPLSVTVTSGNANRAYSLRFGLIDTTALANDVIVVCRQVRESLNQPTRPSDHNLVGLRRLADAEMDPQVTLRDVTVSAANLFYMLVGFALLEGDNCPKSSPIRLNPNQLQADEIVA